MARILFVCLGNTCRSPMAAALGRAYLAGRGVAGVEIASAGEAAFTGDPAPREAQQALEGYGLSLADHRAQLLTEEMVAVADLVLVMSLAQRDRLRRRWPQYAGKIFALKEYAAGADVEAERARGLELAARVAAMEREETAGQAQEGRPPAAAQEVQELAQVSARLKSYDVTDPLGGGEEAYRRCAKELAEAVTAALARFLENTPRA